MVKHVDEEKGACSNFDEISWVSKYAAFRMTT